MYKYIIYCTPEQVKKALKLGAPIQKHASYYTVAPHTHICPVKDLDELDKSSPIINDDLFIVPTAEQMLCWLEEQGFIIEIILSDENENPWTFTINKDMDVYVYNTRKEATLAAIDAALDYLFTNQKKLN